jgi:hypothetical protein
MIAGRVCGYFRWCRRVCKGVRSSIKDSSLDVTRLFGQCVLSTAVGLFGRDVPIHRHIHCIKHPLSTPGTQVCESTATTTCMYYC